MSLNLEEVERLKHLILEPMADAIKAEFAPMVTAIQSELKPLVEAKLAHEQRLAKLEGNQKKALMGYAGIVAVLTVAFNYVKTKYLSKFFT